MIDFSRMEEYRENNRIEAKKVLGGLPESIWETVSAFANTIGGYILLSVEEYKDKSLHIVDLPDPESMVEQFWGMSNDPHVLSTNILTQEDIRIETEEGKRFIVVDVSPAQLAQRPIYIGDDVLRGTYSRNGEGDYRCAAEEIRCMLLRARRANEERMTSEKAVQH